MALWLQENLEAPAKELMEVGDGTLNLLLSWGTPRVVFCTHMDTVPPYIAPKFPEGIYLSKTSLRDPSHPNGWAPPTYYPPAAPSLVCPWNRSKDTASAGALQSAVNPAKVIPSAMGTSVYQRVFFVILSETKNLRSLAGVVHAMRRGSFLLCIRLVRNLRRRAVRTSDCCCWQGRRPDPGAPRLLRKRISGLLSSLWESPRRTRW